MSFVSLRLGHVLEYRTAPFSRGRGHCVPGHGHQAAGLGNDAVLLRLPLNAGAGGHRRFFTVMQLVGTRGPARGLRLRWSSAGTSAA